MINDEHGAHSEENDTQDQFVLVLDPSDNDPVEILLSEDGTLPITSLDHAFPGAHGLKYKNPNTGGKRIVLFDDKKNSFLAPSDGWSGKMFDVIFQLKPPIVTTSDIVVKTEQIENETTILKRKHEILENENNNNKVYKKDNLVVEVVNNEKSNIDNQVVNEEIRNNKTNGDYNKEEFISKISTKSGNFEFPPTVAKKVPSDLIVFGLPYELEDYTFREYFEQFGAVEYEEIKRKSDGTSRGFAFVRMVNYVDQIRALSVSEHIIGGRECILKLSVQDKGRGCFYDNISTIIKPRLYIGTLAGDVGRDRLREYVLGHLYRFDKRSTILEIFYPNPFRHFAFVTVTSSISARELLRQRDFFIDGHYFMVTLAMPKKGEEMVTHGIVAPQFQNQRLNGWYLKQGHSQMNTLSSRGPPPVINNRAKPPEAYWNKYINPPSVPPPPLPQQLTKYPPQQFGAYKGNIKEYIGPKSGGGVSFDNVFPPRGERGFVYGPPHKPRPATYDQSAYSDGVFTRRAPSTSYDPHKEFICSVPSKNPHKLGLPDNYDSWVGDGAGTSNSGPPINTSSSDIRPNDAESMLSKLPNDAVSTALRMLQSIMTAQNQQKERNCEGRNEEEG